MGELILAKKIPFELVPDEYVKTFEELVIDYYCDEVQNIKEGWRNHDFPSITLVYDSDDLDGLLNSVISLRYYGDEEYYNLIDDDNMYINFHEFRSYEHMSFLYDVEQVFVYRNLSYQIYNGIKNNPIVEVW